MTAPARAHVCMLLQRSLEHDSRVRREAAALMEAGHRVTILELAPTGSLPDFNRRRVPGHPLEARRGIGLRLAQLGVMLRFLVAIVRLRPAIVHAHDVAMLMPGLVGSRLVGAPLVYDSHELASGVAYRRGALARIVTGVERLGIRRAACVITVSDSIAERLKALHALAHRPVVLRNFCALRRPRPSDPTGKLRERTGIDAHPLILHQGAAAPQRGCESLIQAMAGVPWAHLVFLGKVEGAFDVDLIALARDVGVAERVHFVPSVPLGELLMHTREADLGVMLFESTCENYRLTLPNKLFEYVAAGVPIVASAQPETERLVHEHGIGWTVDPADPSAVASAIRRGVDESEDPALRARVRAADARFRWSDERQRLLDAYRKLAA